MQRWLPQQARVCPPDQHPRPRAQEHDALGACMAAVKPAHLQQSGSAAANAWRQLKQGPVWGELAQRLSDAAAAVGLGGGDNDKPPSDKPGS